jgi:hypothetical protein
VAGVVEAEEEVEVVEAFEDLIRHNRMEQFFIKAGMER